MRKRDAIGPETDTAEAEWVWGIHAVEEVMRQDAGKIHELVVRKGGTGRKVREIVSVARNMGIRVRFMDFDRLGWLKRYHHQGVAVRMRPVSLLPLDDLLAVAGAKGTNRVLVLDSIQDPRNLGSIFRSAVGAGFLHVVLPRERVAPVSRLAASASAGAVFHLKLYQAVNLRNTLTALRKAGFWIFGGVADPEAIPIYEADLTGPVCLVVGSEGKGIRPLVRRACDQLVTIPMQQGFDSLNVSVAAALLMFEVVRQQG